MSYKEEEDEENSSKEECDECGSPVGEGDNECDTCGATIDGEGDGPFEKIFNSDESDGSGTEKEGDKDDSWSYMAKELLAILSSGEAKILKSAIEMYADVGADMADGVVGAIGKFSGVAGRAYNWYIDKYIPASADSCKRWMHELTNEGERDGCSTFSRAEAMAIIITKMKGMHTDFESLRNLKDLKGVGKVNIHSDD